MYNPFFFLNSVEHLVKGSNPKCEYEKKVMKCATLIQMPKNTMTI